MELLSSSGKTHEKLREERKNYLLSQIRILDLKIGDILESQEYKSVNQKYTEKIWKEIDEYRPKIIMLHISNPQQVESLIKQRDVAIRGLEDERNKTEPFQKVIDLKNQKELLDKELGVILTQTSSEKTEAITNQLDSLKKNLEELVDKVFKQLDDAQETYQKPLIDLGMTVKAALEVLESQHRSDYYKIINPQRDLSDLERFQEILAEISPMNFNHKQDEFKYVASQVEIIKKNYEKTSNSWQRIPRG